MKYTSFIFLSLAVFTLVLMCIMYFGYNSAYYDFKNIDSLPVFFKENIYKYRILGTYLFEKYNEWFSNCINHMKIESPKELSYFKKFGSPTYLSIFSFNLIFLVASIPVLLKILRVKKVSSSENTNQFISIIIIILLMVISQYVITPYDNLSYLFLFINIYITNKYYESKKLVFLFVLSFSLFISTLIRESSAISLSYIATLYFFRYKGDLPELLKNSFVVILPTFFFLLAYFGVRWYMGNSDVVQDIYLAKNLSSLKNILGILFFIISLFYIYILSSKTSQLIQKYFLIFTLPYIIIIFLSGILWEIRLFIPILATLIVIYSNKKIA